MSSRATAADAAFATRNGDHAVTEDQSSSGVTGHARRHKSVTNWELDENPSGAFTTEQFFATGHAKRSSSRMSQDWREFLRYDCDETDACA